MLSQSSLEDLQTHGLLSDELDHSDLKSVLNTAKEIIGKRVVKIN
jgi:hypothetical protein